MASGGMVVVRGVRYRVEDAKRLGLVADAKGDADEKAAPKPSNKAREPKNKQSK